MKALKAAHIPSWTVSLAVLEDFFLKFLKDLQAGECWQVLWFSCLFSPWLGKNELCYFLSSFPQKSLGKSMSSWVWRAVQHAASSPTQKMLGGASCLLAASREWRELCVSFKWCNYYSSSAGPSLDLIPRACWLPLACPSHDLLFLFQKVKYSGRLFKDWSFFLQ